MLQITVLEFQGKAEDDGVLKAPRIQAAEAEDPVELILHRIFVEEQRLARVGKRLVFLKIDAEQGEVVRVERGEDTLAECPLCRISSVRSSNRQNESRSARRSSVSRAMRAVESDAGRSSREAALPAAVPKEPGCARSNCPSFSRYSSRSSALIRMRNMAGYW